MTFSFAPVPGVNLKGTNDSRDVLIHVTHRLDPLNLAREQQKGGVIREVNLWKNLGVPDESSLLPIAPQYYCNEFHHVVLEDDFRYPFIYDDSGEAKKK